MRPWVTKKIVEYLGEEEIALIDYICEKLEEGANPENMEEQLRLVLEEEALDFMIRMWRMLIYNVLVYVQEEEARGLEKGEGGLKVSYSLCWNLEGGETGEEIADLVLSWDGGKLAEEGAQCFRIWRETEEEHQEDVPQKERIKVLEGIAFTSSFVLPKLNFSKVREYLFLVEPVSASPKIKKYPILVNNTSK